MKELKKILKQTKCRGKLKLDFSRREIMKEIKLATYIIDNHNALENLRQHLTKACDEFAHYGPTAHGLLVENSKENVKLEKSLK